MAQAPLRRALALTSRGRATASRPQLRPRQDLAPSLAAGLARPGGGLPPAIPVVIIDDNADDGSAVADRRRTVRLSPEVIVGAAVRVAARAEPDGLTGKALGNELGVDRSAVWRHFADRDALLLAVGDRLLKMAVDGVPQGLAPRERLVHLAGSVVELYVAHPYVGAAVACRTLRGPGELAAIEMTLASLQELGLSKETTARFQRMFADTVLSYAGMRAGYAVLPQQIRDADEQLWAGTHATVSPECYPALAAHVPYLARQDDDSVFASLLEAFRLAVAHDASSQGPTQ
ncbi:TetR/AcrR family transcriptional regulator [Streptomyces decoyicus]